MSLTWMRAAIDVLGLAMVATAIPAGIAMVVDMAAEEGRSRVERLPFAILRRAARRVPEELRSRLYDETWLPDLEFVVRETEGLPVTRLIRGTWFAAGVWWSARRTARALDPLYTSRWDSFWFNLELLLAVRELRRTTPVVGGPDLDWSLVRQARRLRSMPITEQLGFLVTMTDLVRAQAAILVATRRPSERASRYIRAMSEVGEIARKELAKH